MTAPHYIGTLGKTASNLERQDVKPTIEADSRMNELIRSHKNGCLRLNEVKEFGDRLLARLRDQEVVIECLNRQDSRGEEAYAALLRRGEEAYAALLRERDAMKRSLEHHLEADWLAESRMIARLVAERDAMQVKVAEMQERALVAEARLVGGTVRAGCIVCGEADNARRAGRCRDVPGSVHTWSSGTVVASLPKGSPEAPPRARPEGSLPPREGAVDEDADRQQRTQSPEGGR